MKFSEGGQFENAPAGSHIARCVQLIDMGTQQHSWNNETWTSRDVRIVFELPLELMEGKYDGKLKGRPFAVGMTLKQSLHASSKMRKILEGWRGKAFDQDSLKEFQPKNLLGRPCRLALIEKGDFVNIDSVAPLGKAEQCPKQVNPNVYLSLVPDEFDAKTFHNLGEKTKEKISGSPEYKHLMGEDGGGPRDPEPEQAAVEEEIPF